MDVDCKEPVAKNKMQGNCNAEKLWMTWLKEPRQGQHVMLIFLNFYFVLSTFNYTPLGFIFLQFSTWGFFLLTTNPL